MGKDDGESALVKATYQAQTDIAELLLKHGADARTGSAVGNTPLLWASQNGFDDLARDLLAKGADPNTLTKWDQLTPLYFAAANGHTEIVKMLLAHGARVDVRDKQGNPLLKVAASHPDIVQLLTQAGATP